MIDKDDMVRQYVKTSLESAYRPVGTVRTGPAESPGRWPVSEATCMVSMASTFATHRSWPSTVRANMNLTSIMIGERVSDWLRDD
jgi:choline dehydrogenase